MSSSAVPNSGPAVPTAPPVRRSGLSWWKALVTGAVGAAVVNLIVLAVAKLAGASLIVVDGGEQHPITVGGVIGASVVPLVVGTGAALLMALWKPVFLRIAQYVGGGLALLSVAGPLSSGADGGTVAALSLMHITLGVAVVTTLKLHRRHH
ncbi:hypothetical protein HW130_10340 [Streptomyces sp. PKU-EA00015]|uniref:DUF6069 family protein n=1 Tax=Streptomyces sp. PKU-EA00015 TaxID=2748326 RepID=UPI0015A22E26|nr:DUF6069 family protein [Streptomyces sp. PKU-EA00015]NWF26670.1 hypothetical protein [Streptomyces sp. PKU-EA00015]